MSTENKVRTASEINTAAQIELDNFHQRIDSLAMERIELLRPWWQEAFPDRCLEIIFGNGSELVTIDGKSVDTVPNSDGTFCVDGEDNMTEEELMPLVAAVNDVIVMTNGYRQGCPDDFLVPAKEKT